MKTKNSKRITSAILIAAMTLLSLTGCGNGENPDSSPTKSEKSMATEDSADSQNASGGEESTVDDKPYTYKTIDTSNFDASKFDHKIRPSRDLGVLDLPLKFEDLMKHDITFLLTGDVDGSLEKMDELFPTTVKPYNGSDTDYTLNNMAVKVKENTYHEIGMDMSLYNFSDKEITVSEAIKKGWYSFTITNGVSMGSHFTCADKAIKDKYEYTYVSRGVDYMLEVLGVPSELKQTNFYNHDNDTTYMPDYIYRYDDCVLVFRVYEYNWNEEKNEFDDRKIPDLALTTPEVYDKLSEYSA